MIRPMEVWQEKISVALNRGDFGALSSLERDILRLWIGDNDPARDLDEIAAKTGQSQELVGVIKEALLLRLKENAHNNSNYL